MNSKHIEDIIPVFDTIFSFDNNDCRTFGFERILSTFSAPPNMAVDGTKKTKAFFIGQAGGSRTKLMKDCFKYITQYVGGCKFYIIDAHKKDIEKIKDVTYNQRMSYLEEIQMVYNTDCVVEIVREGQTGISLRTCEAVCFNKKMITNNKNIMEMPFYDEKYIRYFSCPYDIDIDFIKSDINVDYGKQNFFSPLLILERLEEIALNKSL